MIELQQKLLGDRVRNEAFADALKNLIQPGRTTVTDIGSGTGFLSFLASKFGARECFLYEADPELLALSQKLARRNGITNCRFFPCHSTEAKNPPKTDLLLCETLGNAALEENILETMNEARRFLKPGGALVPSSLDQFIVPVISPRPDKFINAWERVGFDLNFTEAKNAAYHNMYVTTFKPADLLDRKSAQSFDRLDFSKHNTSVRRSECRWLLKKPQAVWGFAMWWEARLAPDIALSTSPFSPATHWEQIYLPLEKPIPAGAGETLALRISSDTRYEVGIRMSWEAHIFKNGKLVKKSTVMDTARGL